jgi:hypothetical protein
MKTAAILVADRFERMLKAARAKRKVKGVDPAADGLGRFPEVPAIVGNVRA